jgi:hypothetical protein
VLSGDYLDKHPIRNSHVMNTIGGVHSFFQEESSKIKKNNQQVVLHTAVLECICVTLDISDSTVPATLKDFSQHVSYFVNT